jgi:predicted flap endonuclease-1-like 5' DNA nuclease
VADSAADASSADVASQAEVASPAADTSAATDVSAAAATPPAAKGDDSLNLVRLVGPAVLKRVVPVAAAVVIVVLLGRQFRHRLRRGAKG